MGTVVGLDGVLTQQVARPGKRPKELVVEVIAVGNDHHRRVVQPLDDFARVKHHGQALARPLGVPHDPAFAVSFHGRCLGGALHRLVHGVVLVIGRDLFDGHHRGEALCIDLLLLFEHCEIPDQIQQCGRIQLPLNHRLQLRVEVPRLPHAI